MATNKKGDEISLLSSKEEEPPPEDIEPSSSLFNSTNLKFNPLNSNLLSELEFKNQKSDFIIGKESKDFKTQFFPNEKIEEWNNWRWQIKNSIKDYNNLERIFGKSMEYNSLIEKKLPFRITPYYAGVVYKSLPLQKCVIPSLNEIILSEGESIDPLKEDHDSPVEGIVHRYPDRVLFLVTSFCSTNCRYCTRSRIVGSDFISKTPNITRWNNAIEYIKNHPEIRDVVISGGDPLTLSDISLNYILSKLRNIKHIEIIRIGTKVPVVLPMRITKNLLRILKKYHPLYMSIHFTHPDEITEEVRVVCNNIADAGIPMGSQTVLLKEVNDNPEVIKNLYHKLLTIRVRPYYLYQCDPIVGSAHFRTTVETGINIIENLRGWTSGYAIPHYVIDAPGGGGKIPILPDYYLGKDEKGNIILRNYENNKYLYHNDN